MVEHRNRARQYLYRATISESEVRGSMVSELTEQLFGGDVTALMSHLLTAREISPGDLARVKQLVEAKETEGEVGRDDS